MTFSRCGARLRAWTVAATSLMAGAAWGAEPQDVNVYTTREPGLIQPLFDVFTKETGIKVNAIFVESGVGERVEAEGANSPADVITVVDYGVLTDMVKRGLTQKVQSQRLDAAIPVNLRDPDGHWYALSMRARVIYVSAERVAAKTMTYEELADPQWKGRVCIRSGQHPYNTSLFAAMIAKDGAPKPEAFLTALRANLGRTAGGGDRDVARDILADICDVGVGNSYYVGLMRSGKGGPEQQQWGEAIRVILPTFVDGLGTHVDQHRPEDLLVSGGGRRADRPHHRGARTAYRRSAAAGGTQRPPQGRQRTGRQGRLRPGHVSRRRPPMRR